MKPSFFIIFGILFCGCAHMPFKRAPHVPPERFQVSGDLVNPTRLHAGGPLGLAMFKAGPQAEAGEMVDRVSLMLLKGMKEAILEQHTALTLTNDMSQTQLMMQGYIEEYYQPGRFDRVVMRRGRRLSVSGEIWQQDSGIKVLTFGSSEKLLPKEDPLDAAYHMGRAIGNFIGEEAAKGPS